MIHECIVCRPACAAPLPFLMRQVTNSWNRRYLRYRAIQGVEAHSLVATRCAIMEHPLRGGRAQSTTYNNDGRRVAAVTRAPVQVRADRDFGGREGREYTRPDDVSHSVAPPRESREITRVRFPIGRCRPHTTEMLIRDSDRGRRHPRRELANDLKCGASATTFSAGARARAQANERAERMRR